MTHKRQGMMPLMITLIGFGAYIERVYNTLRLPLGLPDRRRYTK